jgi:hypothetical protein
VEMHETFTHSVEDNGKTTNKGNTTLNSSQQNNVETNTNSNISRDNNNTTKNETLSNNDLIAVTQDTPQSMLTDDDIKQNMYASKTQYDKTSNNGSSSTDIDISENTNEETKNSTDSQNVTNENQNSSHETDNINKRTETYTRLQEGSSAGLPYSDAIKQWRNIMVNIDMMVIDELEQLFMQIW